MHFLVLIMHTRYLRHSTLYTITWSILGFYTIFSYIVIQYASTPIFLSTGGLTSNNCIYGYRGVLSGKARKQVFQTSEGLVAGISNKLFHFSEGGFSDQITSDKIQTSLR